MTAPRRTAEERRTDVIEAAMIEFGTYGYHGGSTERIATAAEISQPYVLRLFGTKLKLFLATLDHVHQVILHGWQKALAPHPELRGWSALIELGKGYGGDGTAANRFRMILQGAAASEIPEIEAAINADMDHLWSWVKTTTEASDEEIQRFWAYGMMQTMAIAMNAPKYLNTSDRARGMFILPSS